MGFTTRHPDGRNGCGCSYLLTLFCRVVRATAQLLNCRCHGFKCLDSHQLPRSESGKHSPKYLDGIEDIRHLITRGVRLLSGEEHTEHNCAVGPAAVIWFAYGFWCSHVPVLFSYVGWQTAT